MHFIGLSILMQVLCAVHIIRTGRNSLWLWAVVLLSVPGCLAYFVIEIAPDLWGGRRGRAARSKAMSLLDPDRELRAAQAELDVVRTPANHIRLADALAQLGRYADAIAHYEKALAGHNSGDTRTTYKLARALFHAGQAARALPLLDELSPPGNTEGDRVALLRARILEAMGREADALTILACLVTRYPGEEARCRYAHLLIRAGRTQEAIAVLAEVDARAKRLTRQQRAAERDMYDWAAAELYRLRAG